MDAAEQPGIGKAIGAVVGAAGGLSGGSLLMAAVIPGVGPVTALGLLGAAVVGAAGATVGASVGQSLEISSRRGLPEDEIFVYEDALRKGRSVVIAMAEDSDQVASYQELLKSEGAETVDAARREWWIGLRSAERERYLNSGKDFEKDEKFYRMGFEAALHAKMRCKEFDQVSAEMANNLEELQRAKSGSRFGRRVYTWLSTRTGTLPASLRRVESCVGEGFPTYIRSRQELLQSRAAAVWPGFCF